MQISIPIRVVKHRLSSKPIARGQLYNLDDNEYFDLQFNPRVIEPRTEYGWSDDPWMGSDKVSVQFLGIGQTDFDLQVEFLVDPGAPRITYRLGTTNLVLTYQDGAENNLIRIENIIRTIEQWGAVRDDKGRSSLIGITMGKSYWEGRMINFAPRIEERFRDGLIRKATLRIGFKQWRRAVLSR